MRSSWMVLLGVLVLVGGCAQDGRGGDGGDDPEGQHCGGNTEHPKTCPEGYTCKPDPNSTLPFGDVGGFCDKD